MRIATLQPLLLLAACGPSALAQSADSAPERPRSGPVYPDTSAKATPARATPVHPAPSAPAPLLTSPANANRAVLVPVMANTRDTSSVSTSFLGEPIDLRAPLHFDRVFALRSRAPSDMRSGTLLNFGGGNVATSGSQLDTEGAKWFARVDGAIIALFPRSTYSETSEGTVVDIPAGTIFAIGHPPAAMFGLDQPAPMRTAAPAPEEDASRPIARQAHSSAARTRPAMLAPAQDEPAAPRPRATEPATDSPAPAAPSVFGDDAYRARRVRGLLLKAASTHAAPHAATSNARQ